MAIELVEWAGGDESHALSAWTSTKRELTEERKGRIGEMLKMLAQSDPPHTSPFEKSYLHFVVDVEQASHIQMVKHRVGVSINVESARYKEHKEDRWHVPEDWPSLQQEHLEHFCRYAFYMYHEALKELEPVLGRKRAKESARFYLPMAHVLTMDVSFNFHSFMHFVKLRKHPDAQKEIRDIASEMLALVRATHDFDLSLEAYGLAR